jgi:glycosyltransferase involved in cell wall biosynthesis
MPAETGFNLDRFEFLCYSRSYESAAQELVRLVKHLDQQYGKFGQAVELRSLQGINVQEVDQHLLSRMASAISVLFGDPNFSISKPGFQLLMPFHRWISAIFAASPFRNADHVIRSLNTEGFDLQHLRVSPHNFYKFCLLYSPESEISMDLQALWNHDKQAAASLFLTLLSPRFLGTPMAHSKRELLLAWLPDRLGEIQALDQLPAGILHDVYMHCSYADLPTRHEIKKPINRLIRSTLDRLGIQDLKVKKAGRLATKSSAEKPVMLVLVEWFNSRHSIYRTHSRAIAGARQWFHLVGVGYGHCVDDLGKGIFDEFITIESNKDFFSNIRQLLEIARNRSPDIFYMPSVGMFPITMYMTNLRLARLQIAALGHPATTHSNKIDYISVEEDFVGDPACFSEKLLRLPKDGQPYRPSALAIADYPKPEIDPGKIRIGIAATTMKLNPRFLSACKEISAKVTAPHEFHFLVGQNYGLVKPQVKALIRRYLPAAVVHPHRDYPDYMRALNDCDFFLSPFPFGNTNGIVDAAHLGLPGVCLSGPEVFEHIDQGLFARMKYPPRLVTSTLEQYISTAASLANDADSTRALRQKLIAQKAVDNLFKGRDDRFGFMCTQLLKL